LTSVSDTSAVDIRPRVSGYIDRIAFKEGDIVKARSNDAPERK
jgi:multidrug efflux pump subunit AcrA (membrane-fusion protein)